MSFQILQTDRPLHLEAKEWLLPSLHGGALVIDATVGNGHDTLFLYQNTKPRGTLLAFDIQLAALEEAQKKFPTNETRIHWLNRSHDSVGQVLSEKMIETVDAAIFNLGYLPGSDHRITTQPSSTLSCLGQILPKIKVGGRISLVTYRGHPGGPEEDMALFEFLSNLAPESYEIIYSSREDKPDSPVFYGLRKLSGDDLERSGMDN